MELTRVCESQDIQHRALNFTYFYNIREYSLMVERLTFNQTVAGSNPATLKHNRFRKMTIHTRRSKFKYVQMKNSNIFTQAAEVIYFLLPTRKLIVHL